MLNLSTSIAVESFMLPNRIIYANDTKAKKTQEGQE